jgi:hypothetical protein
MDQVGVAWANFFVAEVGAAAAPSGLIIVAISINLQRILSFPQLPDRFLYCPGENRARFIVCRNIDSWGNENQ